MLGEKFLFRIPAFRFYILLAKFLWCSAQEDPVRLLWATLKFIYSTFPAQFLGSLGNLICGVIIILLVKVPPSSLADSAPFF